MTIKLPVRITYESDAKGFASYPHFVDADGYHVEFSALATALNATAPAPDLTAIANRILDVIEREGLAVWPVLGDADAAASRDDLTHLLVPILTEAAFPQLPLPIFAPAPNLNELLASATLAADRLEEIRYFNGDPDPRYHEPARRLRAALALFPEQKDGDEFSAALLAALAWAGA